MTLAAAASALAVVLGLAALVLMLASVATAPRNPTMAQALLRLMEAAGLAACGVTFLCLGAAYAAM